MDGVVIIGQWFSKSTFCAKQIYHLCFNPILTTGGADYQALRDSQSEEALGNGHSGQLAFHLLALQIYYEHKTKLANIYKSAQFERD